MKKILCFAAAIGISCSAFFLPKQEFKEAKASSSTLPSTIYYLNMMDYKGTNSLFGEWTLSNGVATIEHTDFTNSSGGGDWKETYHSTPNLLDYIDVNLTNGFALSFDVSWPFELDWSKLFIVLNNGTEQINACFQRNTDDQVYSWIEFNGNSYWANNTNQGGYLTSNPLNTIGQSVNLKVAINNSDRISLFIDNNITLSYSLSKLGGTSSEGVKLPGYTVKPLTDLRIYGRCLNDAIATTKINVDNLLIEEYKDGDPILGATANIDLSSDHTLVDDYYQKTDFNNHYICHLGYNHSFKMEADLKFGTNVLFDFYSYDLNGNNIPSGYDTSIAVRFGYDSFNTRFYGVVVFADGDRPDVDNNYWQFYYFALNGEIKANIFQSYKVIYLSNRLIINIDGLEVFNKTYNELGLAIKFSTSSSGTIHLMNYNGSTINIKNASYSQIFDTTASISSDSTLKTEVNNFVTTYMANRVVVDEVYSICGILSDADKLTTLVNTYNSLSVEAKEVLMSTYDGSHVTVGQTMEYLSGQLALLSAKSSSNPLTYLDINVNPLLVISFSVVISLVAIIILIKHKKSKANI